MFLYHALLDGLKTGHLAYPLSQYSEVYKRLCGDDHVTELGEQFKVRYLLLLLPRPFPFLRGGPWFV